MKHVMLSSKPFVFIPSHDSACFPQERRCSAGRYLDDVTGRCEPCGQLCDHALLQGTQVDCNKLCIDYAHPGRAPPSQPTCPPGQYYDDVISRCDYCSNLCYHHQIQGTSDDCRKNCPNEYYEKTTATTTTPLSTPTTSTRPAGGAEPQSVVAAGVVVACGLSATIIVVSVAGLLLLCCQAGLPCGHHPPRKAPVTCTDGYLTLQSTMGGTVKGQQECLIYMPVCKDNFNIARTQQLIAGNSAT